MLYSCNLISLYFVLSEISLVISLVSPFCLLLKTSYHFSYCGVTFPFRSCFWKLTPKISDTAECWVPSIPSETGGIQSLPAPDLKGGLCLQKEALVCALISDISGQPHQGKSLAQKRLFFSLQRQNNDVSLELYDFALSFISQTIYSYCFCHIQVKFKL